ncbi:MAG: ATP-binding protein [Pseudobdellovibrionaceae bacterium]
MSDDQELNQRLLNIDTWKAMYFNSPQATLIGSSEELIYEVNLAARKLLNLGSENIQGLSLNSLIERLDKPVKSMIHINRSSISINQEPLLIIYLQDIHEQKFSERLLSFFATTLKALDFPLTLSFNLKAMLEETAHVAIKNMADLCRIDLLQDSKLKLESLAHINLPIPISTCQFEYLTTSDDADDLFNPLKVIRSGVSVFESNIYNNVSLNQGPSSKNFELLDKLKLSSYICVPIKTADKVLGCLSLARNDLKQNFDAIDLIMAEEFASKIGVNIERAQLYKNLEELTRKADAASQAKTNFLANVSHEIRTPLSAILGFSELLTSADRSPQDYLNYKSKIRSNSEYLLRIIDDILDLTKVEAGKLVIEKNRINLKALLGNVYEIALDRASGKNIAVEFRISEPIPLYIYSDEIRLSQILSNIIGNSVKFTNEGYVQVNVSLKMNPATNQELLLVEVIDTGIGISEDQFSSLFKPFSQADASYTRKYGGTGLGLALSRNLAKELGGDLTLRQSDLGMGSTFWITINPGKVDKQETFTELTPNFPIQNTEESQLNPNLPLKNKRILLVEDSTDIQLLFKRFLEGAGATVILAGNGDEGIKAAQNEVFHAILMDVQMPVKDGIEATRELRSQGYDGLIIALTAHAMKEEHEFCAKAGYNAHLTKPIRRSDLISNILKLAQIHKQNEIGNSSGVH